MTKKNRNGLITLVILASPFLIFLGFLLFWDTEPLPPVPQGPVTGTNTVHSPR